MNKPEAFNSMQAANQEDKSETSLFEVFHMLWFRRHLLLSVALFLTAIGMILLFQQPLRYAATASALIGTQKSQIVDIEAIVAGISTGYGSDITSEIEILKSRQIAKKIVEKFNLVSQAEFNPALRPAGMLSYVNPIRYIPESWKPTISNVQNTLDDYINIDGSMQEIDKKTASIQDYFSDAWKMVLGVKPKEILSAEEFEERKTATAVSIFLSKLSVKKVDYSNIVSIRFESFNRDLVARVANEIPDSYIYAQLEAKLNATKKATGWLTGQLEELKQTVESSEQAVELYRKQNDITEIQGGEIVTAQLSAVNSQLIIARVERAEIEARYRQFKNLVSAGGRGATSSSEVLASGLVQALVKQEAAVARKLSELSTEYGARHPKMIQVKAEVADIRNKIKQEIIKVGDGLKDEVDIVRIRERSLESSLFELKLASGVQNQKSVQLRALEREATANRSLYQTFLTRFKETNSIQSKEEADARVISKALPPSGAFYPNKSKTTMLIILGAFSISAMLVLLIQMLSPGLMSPEQVEAQLGLATIGLIPMVKGKDPAEYVLKKPHSSYGEALYSLRTSLILSGPDESVKTILITSSVPEEGKSMLALSFARLLANSGKKTILVDGDLRRGSLEKKMGIGKNSIGLTDWVISRDQDYFNFVVGDEKSDLLLLPKGGAEYVNPSDVFASHRMKDIVKILRSQFDYVIFDSPPVMAVSDSRILGSLVDKTVFVIRWDKTPKKVIESALDQLRAHEIDLAGCVLQQVNLKRSGSYGYGASGYYYHYGKYGGYYSS